MVTFICCIFVTIYSSIVAIVAVRDPSAWRLKPDMELISIGYSVSIKNKHIARNYSAIGCQILVNSCLMCSANQLSRQFFL